MNEYSVYVGLDVHKDTIAVAIAPSGRDEPHYHGEIAHTRTAIKRLMAKLSPDGEVLGVCFEAGPSGYGVYNQIQALGHDYVVVAPGLITRKVKDSFNTDHRVELSLAQCL